MKRVYAYLRLLLALVCLSLAAQAVSASPAAEPIAQHDAQSSGMSTYSGATSNSATWLWSDRFSGALRGAATATALGTDDTILQLPFEDGGSTTADVSGHGNNGIVNNAVFVPGGGVFTSSAYRFSWSGQSYIQVPYDPSEIVTAALTLEAWVYPTAWDNVFAGYNRIVSMYPCYLIRGVSGRAQFQILTQNHGYQDVLDSDVMALNQWHYVVGTFDGQVLKLYVDGVLKESRDLLVTDTVVPNEQPIYVGENPQLNEGFSGTIDNVAIYKRARLQSEIEQTYTQPPLALYTLSVTNTAADGAGGTIISSDGEISCGTGMVCQEVYSSGTLVTLTAVPDPSSYFAGWSGNGCGSNLDCVVFMDADTTVTGRFEIKSYHTITATAGAHGSIQPEGIVEVGHDSDLEFTIAADDDYHITDVLVDNVPVGPVASYTFSHISRDHTIAATFGQYVISGRVRTASGQGIAGVVMSGLPGNPTTDIDGSYQVGIGTAWSGTVTPSKANYYFYPSFTNTSVPPDRTNLNFMGVPLFSISGRIADASGNAISGVTVTAWAGHTTTTNATGNYTFTGLQQGTYQIAPAKIGLAFSPVSSVVQVTANTTVNFLGATLYTLSNCRVIDEYHNPVSGARVMANSGQTTTTNSGGWFTLQVPAGQVTLYISKARYWFPPFTFPVTKNIYERDFAGSYIKLPIVFVHGWGSNFESTFKEGSGPNIPDALERAGYHIEFATLSTTTAYTVKFEDNVGVLKAAIERAKAATGRSKVIIIAHSMGGLVSRLYIEGPVYNGETERLGYQNDVSELFTFGSPHSGTPIAVFNVFGALGPGVFQMTPENMTSFNQDHQRRAGVIYHVIGGDASMDTDTELQCNWWWGIYQCWPIQVPKERTSLGWTLGQLIEGQDDAFVPTDSATRLSGWIDRASSDEVHGRALGDHTYFNRGFASGSPMSQSYAKCLEKVLIDRTTNTCGQWSWGERIPLSANGLVLPSQPEAQAPLQQHTPILSGKLHAGEQFTRTIPIDEGGKVSFAAHWTSGSAAATLIDPTGQAIDPSFTAKNPDRIFYKADSSTALYVLGNALPGEWQLVLTGGSDIPTEGSDYFVFAAMQSTLAVAFQMDRLWYAADDLAHISASFSDITSGNTVAATLRYSDGTSASVPLTLKTPGQYEGSVAVADIPGYTIVHVQASGINANGAPFARADDLLFQVSPHSAAFNTTYAETLESRPDDPTLYSALTVTVGIDSTIDGQIGLSGDLVDGDGAFIAHGIALKAAIPGANTLALRFEGSAIFAAQKNGPYHLTNLLLSDEREAPLVIAEALDAFSTAAYDYRTFADRHAFPTVSAGGPYSGDVGGSIAITASGNDPENDALAFAWDLDDDGVFETPGQNVSFSAAEITRPSTFNLSVQIADANGFTAIAQTTLDVLNVPPAVAAGADATLQPGATLTRAGTFSDPGADTWTATVDYGDGTGPEPLALTGKQFELNHLYTDPGLYPVTVTVSDDLDGVGTATFTVNVSKLPGDRDGDGVLDTPDACPYSNLSATVVIGTCDTSVGNPVNANGCSILDQVVKCAVGVQDQGEFVGCVSRLTDDLKNGGIINGSEEGAIQSCAETAPISPAAPHIALVPASNSIQVQWSPVSVDIAGRPITVSHYEVWWSPLPYFVPGVPGYPGPGAEMGETTYTDTTAPTGLGLRRAYRVRAVSALGTASGLSNAMAVFSFALAPGD